MGAGATRILADYFLRRIIIFGFIAVMLIMGIVFGVIAANSLESGQKSELGSWVREFFQTVEKDDSLPVREVVRLALWGDVVKTAGLIWLAGLSIIGAPLILGLCFLRGFVLGFTAGFIVSEMKLSGVLMVLAAVIPHNIFTVPAVILAGGAALSFSVAAAKTLFGRQATGVSGQLFSSTLLCLVAGGLLIIGTVVEVYITPVFIDLLRGYVL